MRVGRICIGLLAVLMAGCQVAAPSLANAPVTPPSDPMAVARAEARHDGKPLAVLVVDETRSDADRTARGEFATAVAGDSSVIAVVLDLGTSRSRATAGLLHALDQPALLYFTPSGLVIRRDAGVPSAPRIQSEMAAAASCWPALDAERARLDTAVAETGQVSIRWQLATFLLEHEDNVDAIPPLTQVAHDESADLNLRVRAWVAMGRAHLWLGEPEKARHAAMALIDTLGRRAPDAIAGGNLVRGLQDMKARRFDRARDELNAAVAAAPQSSYGTEAADALTHLPK